ncbi:hypothetical protein [Pseudomonas viridiflava]|uniref:hypothetical protein n=1 Tax=Pseudomonas viridiflava TaxID=33069 RepID=UPI0013CE4E53|nr:hypothetical protein [Pseudomonas viridiflava]
MIEATLGWPKETYEHYSSGNCMHLAAALHRKLGWEIQLTLHSAEGQYLPYVEHAWVVDPGGTFCLCADGLYPINRNGFISASSPLHTKLSEQDLKAMTLLGAYRPFTDAEWDESILKAIAIVERYFPLESIISMFGLAEISGLPVAAKEFTIATLPVLYHGTSRRQWRKRHDEPSYLNLTSSFEDAQRYAEEWAESEFEDYGNCHPMVMRIPPPLKICSIGPVLSLSLIGAGLRGRSMMPRKIAAFSQVRMRPGRTALQDVTGLEYRGFGTNSRKPSGMWTTQRLSWVKR